ncbi:hypothetical protein [Planotetraspora sp. GP83]|uniref:hypothetical protein n=1 Tax=Planotetraspora sp. GP83 TaxID=3156264 RepID=UPI0035130C39
MRSDTGRFWATRERPFSAAAQRAGAMRTVDGDDLSGRQPQRLWLDLILASDDEPPRVHLQLDDLPIATLTADEAQRLGLNLIALATLSAMESPPSIRP